MSNKYNLLDRVIIDESDEVLTIIAYNGFEHDMLYTLADSDGNVYDDIPESRLTYIGPPRKTIKYDLLKMYILVKDSAPIGLGINGCTHAGYLAGKTFDSPIMKDWEEKSFRKVTCIVSDANFYNAIKAIKEVNGNYLIFKENDWGDKELSVAFEPRYSFPEIFKTLDLHSGRHLNG